MLFLIPLFPLAGFLINATLGRRLTKRVSGGLASLAMLASFAVSVFSVWQLASMAEPRVIPETLYRWIASDDLRVDVAVLLDPLSAVMILVVTGIGSLIHIYSTSYMHDEVDSEFARYFSYLNLFAAFMLVLVLGANFLVLFVGWEGVGLCHTADRVLRKKSAADAGRRPSRQRIMTTPSFSVCSCSRLRHARLSAACRDRSVSPEASSAPVDCVAAPVHGATANRRRFRSMSGCRTPWKVRRRYPP
jgi:hypothetical protein